GPPPRARGPARARRRVVRAAAVRGPPRRSAPPRAPGDPWSSWGSGPTGEGGLDRVEGADGGGVDPASDPEVGGGEVGEGREAGQSGQVGAGTRGAQDRVGDAQGLQDGLDTATVTVVL